MRDNRNSARVAALQARLKEKADQQTKDWWEAYLRHAIPFRGVKMADIRAALHTWFRTQAIAESLSLNGRKDLAFELLRLEYAEDKLAGILFFQEFLVPQGAVDWRADVPRFASLFEDGCICDWNTCDWFCVRVLGALAEREGEPCARAIAAWRGTGNLWQRRAAGVAFVNLAKRGDGNFVGFTEMLLEVCAATVQDEERFAQTGTGWVLRELSRADRRPVIDFIECHLEDMSAEALRSATERLPAADMARLRQAHRST